MSHKSIKYLSQRERYLLEKKLKEGKKIKQISNELSRHPSTLYREIKKSGFNAKSYQSSLAEEKYGYRKFEKINKLTNNRLLSCNELLSNRVMDLLKKYSPLIISKRYLKGKVSYGTIYRQIYYLAQKGGKEYKWLYNKHKKRKKHSENIHIRSKIPNRVSIDQRPKIVNELSRIGDFELDLICSKEGYLVSVLERKTKLSFLGKVAKKESKLVSEKVIEMLLPYKKKIKTITTDNGTEFSNHEEIAKKLNCEIYFCDPYSSWQKGMVENFNKLVRKYLPKGLPLIDVTNDKIKEIVNTINNYPRKCLNFKSAYEVFQQNSVATTL